VRTHAARAALAQEDAVTDVKDWNAGVIQEFRARGGEVGGQFEGAPLLLLTTTGRRSGATRTNPMMYLDDGAGRWLVFASKQGMSTHPDWFLNLQANPTVAVEIGDRTVEAKAVVLEGAERDRWYAEQARRYPGFAEYQAKTDRVIPVVALIPQV
jgi:deazaflavin-dependent oxidoreductase (nitroreductase family)